MGSNLPPNGKYPPRPQPTGYVRKSGEIIMAAPPPLAIPVRRHVPTLDEQIDALDRENACLERKIERTFSEAREFFARYDRGEPQPPEIPMYATFELMNAIMDDYDRRVEESRHAEKLDATRLLTMAGCQ